MKAEEFRRHFALEDSHWWFLGRRALARLLLAPYLRGLGPLRFLDAGCGTGANLFALASVGEAFGCDLSEDAVRFCWRRGLRRLARTDISRLPFKSASFGLVTLFDVLYHKAIPNDVAALEEVRRVLRPGGYCFITDSALPILHSPHDEAFGARERYTKNTLRERVEKSGLEVVRMTYFYLAPFPAIFLLRQIHRWRGAGDRPARSDLAPVAPWLNAGLTRIMKGEAALAARMNLPLGSSVVCLARKN